MAASDSESNQVVTPGTFPYTGKPVPVGANDVAAQRSWEHFQVQRGIERYRRTLIREKEDGTTASRDLGEVQHGQRIASDIIRPMVEAVKKAQGVSLLKVQHLLGHASPTMTQKYAHLCPDNTGREAADILDGLHAE